MIAAMASAFAIGQIVGPIGVSYTIGGDGGFSRPLAAAALVLCPDSRRPLAIQPLGPR
jgi:hypothetical protein